MTPNPVPDYLQIAVAWATVLGVLGVLAAVIGLAIQVSKSRTEQKEREAQAVIERERFEKQIAALRQAENDRLAVQARKVVPSVRRADVYGHNMWAVKISNGSTEIVSDLAVLVTAFDKDGNEVPDGWVIANDKINIGADIRSIFAEAIGASLDEVFKRSPAGMMASLTGRIPSGVPSPQQAQQQVKDIFASVDAQNRMQESVQLGLTDRWPDTLTPEQSEMMAIQTTDPSYQVRLAIQYELAGEYTWRRTDKSKPERVSESES